MDPESAQAWFWLGRAAVVTSKSTSYSLAIDAFERALALDPGLIEAHFGLGLAHSGYAHREIAERELTTFLAGATAAQPPQMRGEAEHLLGVLARERGAPDEALGHFARALELHPKFAESAFERGVTLESMKSPESSQDADRIDDAIAAYRAAIALDPSHLSSHFRLARLLRGLGRDEEAAREERIHRLLNELTDDQTGRTTRAPERRAELYGELALLDPQNVRARIEYVRALKELQRDAEAKLALEELLRAAPQLTPEELPAPLRAMMPKR